MKYKLFKILPTNLQNLAISLVNTNLYRVRHGGSYKYYRNYYATWDTASETEIEAESKRRLKNFVNYAKNNSLWFKQRINSNINCKHELQSLPILEKIDIINNFEAVRTICEEERIINNTGGTTGASMRTVYRKYPQI